MHADLSLLKLKQLMAGTNNCMQWCAQLLQFKMCLYNMNGPSFYTLTNTTAEPRTQVDKWNVIGWSFIHFDT